MEANKELQFYKLLEQLVALTQIVNEEPETEKIESLLCELSGMFRLSMGESHFYRDPHNEKNGIGETSICFDNGKTGVPIHTVRFVTRLMSITTMTVYMEEDEAPLTEDEMYKVDIIMRTLLAFVSRNKLQTLAEELAFYDDPGFRNVRSFFRYLSWNSQPGDLSNKVAINYNLRHFALLNEEYGRVGGDLILRNHYRHLESLIGNNGAIARLGGDAFVCICDQTDLPEVLDYLNDATVLASQDGKTAHVSSYAGVFQIPDGYTVRNPGDIMNKIMNAYQLAKIGVQGNIVFFSDMMMSAREKTSRVLKMFPAALKKGEFQVFYQPKVNVETGEICGAEALCRWFHEGKIVPPIEFIPALEETNDICKLDFYMLDKVCEHIRKWLDEKKHAVRISVNLSRRHMIDPELVKTLIDIIDNHNVPHEYIEIELTETTTDVQFKDLKRVVQALQSSNICTSVDDFGMGYSSLNLIRVVPWNVLKVDKIFLPLDEESADSIRSVMFKYVIAMAKKIGLECIVEGVETPAQLKLLRENGCDEAQGYLFDKPLPIAEFEKRLDRMKYELPDM